MRTRVAPSGGLSSRRLKLPRCIQRRSLSQQQYHAERPVSQGSDQGGIEVSMPQVPLACLSSASVPQSMVVFFSEKIKQTIVWNNNEYQHSRERSADTVSCRALEGEWLSNNANGQCANVFFAGAAPLYFNGISAQVRLIAAASLPTSGLAPAPPLVMSEYLMSASEIAETCASVQQRTPTPRMPSLQSWVDSVIAAANANNLDAA